MGSAGAALVLGLVGRRGGAGVAAHAGVVALVRAELRRVLRRLALVAAVQLGLLWMRHAVAVPSRCRAHSAYTAAPSGSTASSNAASGAWLYGPVIRSRSGMHAPRNAIVPGTLSSTREKSSEPVSGLGSSMNLPSPCTALTTEVNVSTSAALLTVTG